MPAGGQVQQNPQQPQRVARAPYQPQQEVITRPLLVSLKQRIDQQMSEQEISSLLDEQDGERLRSLISCEPEVTAIQKLVEKYVSDVEELSKSNAEAKRALLQVLE